MKRLLEVVSSCWMLSCLAASSSQAGTTMGEFRLVEGHAGRQELALAVRAPGAIQVRIESDTPGVEVYAMLIHHAGTVHNAQGSGVIRYDFPATSRHVAQAQEWAVRIQAVTPGQMAKGRISVSFPEAGITGAHEVDTWLQRHPAIGLHLRWVDAQGSHTYSAWPHEMKQRLWQYFDLTRQGHPPALPDPPQNVWNYNGGDDPLAVHTALTPADATNLYLAGVAQSLVLEIDRKVPWSLDDLNEGELDALFSGTSLFFWNQRQQGYEIASLAHGWAVPPPPQVAWQFLRDHDLLRGTRLETITALLGWCKGLSHFAGPVTPDNFEQYWGYRGDMPVSRVLSGTRYAGTEFRQLPGYDQVRHYTAGCHGTVGLLVSLLRAANIPAKYRGVSADTGTHATILFLTEDRALTHGDDPYSQTCVRAAPEELMIDLATYHAWLGPLAPNPGPNIGRQSKVLGLRHLAPIVLRAYEKDKSSGAAREQGEVAAIFKDAYTMQELQAARLWERLDAELSSGASVAAKTAATAPTTPAMREKDDVAVRESNAKNSRISSSNTGDFLLEAESLKPSVSAGEAQEQDMTAFSGGKWSGGRQLWWTGGKVGNTLTLTFAVNAPGVYRIAASFTRAPDYGIVSVAVDGSATKAEKVDLYDTHVTRTDLLPLGEFKLDAGNHRLDFTIAGSNAAAMPSFMVGVDELRFERVE